MFGPKKDRKEGLYYSQALIYILSPEQIPRHLESGEYFCTAEQSPRPSPGRTETMDAKSI